MAKKHGVRQTRGSFLIIGNVKGAQGDRFYKETTFESGAVKREVNFGIETSNNNETYVKVEGYENNIATFNKWDSKEKKSYKKEVPWDERFDFDEEGYQPSFGIRVGLTLDEKGKTEAQNLFQLDAVDEIRENLKDGQGLYVEGDLAFTSYKKDGEIKRYKNFNAKKIYLQKEPVDFSNEDFKEKNQFEQELIFMSIDKELDSDRKETGRFILSALVVTYTGVESVEFIIENKKLAGQIKKGLKPYNMIKVMGRLVNTVLEEEVEDAWGDDEDMHNSTPRNREMVVTKAYPSTIDKETYTEDVIDGIRKADEDFGDSVEESEDEDDVWD